MALIMYWGMFGLGEMDSYISFSARGRRVLMLIPAHFRKCYIAQFLFWSSSLWIVLDRQFYYTSQYKIPLVFIIPSFISLTSLDNIKQTGAIQSWKQQRCYTKMTSFFTHALHKCWWIYLCCVVYFKVGQQSEKIHQESMKVCVILLIVWLFCGAETPGEKPLSGVLFLITQRASVLHISSAASPQVIPVLSLYCIPLPPK